jgi:thioredoxin-related protein
MKKVFVFSVFLLINAASILAQSVKWYSFEDALQLNAERATHGLPAKKIFVDVYTDWCGWCKRMDATTFAHPVIAEKLNTDWIAVKMNAERKDTIVINGKTFVNENQVPRSTHQLAQVLLNGKMSYPSYSLIDETGKSIQVIIGYQEVQQFEILLDFFSSNAYQRMNLEDFQKTFKELIRE